MKVHPAKCVFMASSIDILSHRVSLSGIQPQPQKVTAIKEFPKPETTKKLRKFLGLVNYYNRFIAQAANILAPLHDLLRGLPKTSPKPLMWTQEAFTAFTTIKQHITRLTLPPTPGSLSQQTLLLLPWAPSYNRGSTELSCPLPSSHSGFNHLNSSTAPSIESAWPYILLSSISSTSSRPVSPSKNFLFLALTSICGAIIPVDSLDRSCLTSTATPSSTASKVSVTQVWTEAIPMSNVTAESAVRAFLSGWVSRFGPPMNVITDRGAQHRTTAYHPQSNGMVERFHRQLKDAIKAQHDPYSWTDALPLVLLGIHSSHKEDMDCSPADLTQ
ncbi:uncharacterized protein LOC121879556, partial [Homarus americanus]|uniref:uncharacterized protein LOC121879556 n=1 Tax=Homarus americanus TaxID=6706 RepID=UPI001C4677B7